MFGKLRGKIDTIFEDRLIVDVGGVGYNVYVSSKTIDLVRDKTDQVISLIIETIVREDHIHLYGFISDLEKTWFNELCKVNGVGSKVALKIMSGLSVSDIVLAISSGDQSLFSKTPGIGPKLAQRIISELKSRVAKLGNEFSIIKHKSSQGDLVNVSSSSGNQILLDAVSALENLGYRRSDVYSIASNKIAENSAITLETLITNSLRELSRK